MSLPMNTEAVIAELARRFQKIPDVVLADITKFLDSFQDEFKARIWSEVNETYVNATPPRLAHFVTAAKRLELTKSSKGGSYEYVCYLCTARTGSTITFQLSDPCCPACQNRETSLYALIPRGSEVSPDVAQDIVDRFPAGKHPIYGRDVKDGQVVRIRPRLERAISQQPRQGALGVDFGARSGIGGPPTPRTSQQNESSQDQGGQR